MRVVTLHSVNDVCNNRIIRNSLEILNLFAIVLISLELLLIISCGESSRKSSHISAVILSKYLNLTIYKRLTTGETRTSTSFV